MNGEHPLVNNAGTSGVSVVIAADNLPSSPAQRVHTSLICTYCIYQREQHGKELSLPSLQTVGGVGLSSAVGLSTRHSETRGALVVD